MKEDEREVEVKENGGNHKQLEDDAREVQQKPPWFDGKALKEWRVFGRAADRWAQPSALALFQPISSESDFLI